MTMFQQQRKNLDRFPFGTYILTQKKSNCTCEIELCNFTCHWIFICRVGESSFENYLCLLLFSDKSGKHDFFPFTVWINTTFIHLLNIVMTVQCPSSKGGYAIPNPQISQACQSANRKPAYLGWLIRKLQVREFPCCPVRKSKISKLQGKKQCFWSRSAWFVSKFFSIFLPA